MGQTRLTQCRGSCHRPCDCANSIKLAVSALAPSGVSLSGNGYCVYAVWSCPPPPPPPPPRCCSMSCVRCVRPAPNWKMATSQGSPSCMVVLKRHHTRLFCANSQVGGVGWWDMCRRVPFSHGHGSRLTHYRGYCHNAPLTNCTCKFC